MKIVSGRSLVSNSLVKLKDNNWLEKQRVAGRITAGALMLLEQEVKSRTTKSLLELSELADEYMMDNGCSATFKNYKGFPAAVCISVNKQLVHGIPTDYKLQEGDVVKFDLGATYQRAIADSALTCIYGEPKDPIHFKLITACYESLMKGIAAIKVGSNLGVIGHAIYKSVKGNSNFGLITNYGGHGISWDQPHAMPFVSNKDSPNNGIRIQPGLTIAIEPMLVLGSTETFTEKDNWTVCGMGISSHFEHSIFVHEDHVEIITNRNGL